MDARFEERFRALMTQLAQFKDASFAANNTNNFSLLTPVDDHSASSGNKKTPKSSFSGICYF